MKTKHVINFGTLVFLVAIVSQTFGQQSSFTYDLPGNLKTVAGTNAIAPSITAQPQCALLYSNNTVTLSVVASGVGLSYQWYSNGVAIVGAASDSLVFPNLPSSNYTNFTVIISNATGVVTSTPAAIWADSNGNGIPDWWELKYFGNLNQPADGDYDGDGVSNIDEYREGTNPANSASYNPRLHLQSVYGRVSASPDLPYYTNGQVVTLTAIPDAGETFLGWGGAATGTKASISLVMSSHKTITAAFGVPLPVAMDNSNLVWTTGGNVAWFGQAVVSQDGVSAAQSGGIGNSQQSWLQGVTTNLAQNFQLSFWWNVSSQPPDGLTFSVDGSTAASLSGEAVGWQHIVTSLSFGSHTLLWRYAKDGGDAPTGIPFSDTAWLDQVVLTPVPTPPVITNQPMSQFVLPGASATFNILALGSQPLSYQWFFNGSAQPGATNTSMLLTNLQTSLSTLFAVVTNAYGAATSAVVTLVVNATSCTNAPPGLLAWWSGEDNAVDAVGGNNGAFTGAVSYAPGRVGQALSLSGGYMEITNSAAFTFNPTSPMSVELWAYRTGTASIMHFLGKRDGCGGTIHYQLAFDSSGVGFGGSSGGASTPWQIPLNTWVHLAGTFDGGTFRLYTNGLLAATAAGTLGPAASTPLRIGVSGSCPQAFIGLLDEISIFNRALSSNEVAAIYLAGSNGKCAIPTGPPRFDTSSGHLLWTANGFQMQVTGLSPQRPLVLYTSTNLTAWLPIFTNPPMIGSFQFLDASATNSPMMFYRAVEQ